MLSLETILKDSIWVGKFYEGGRISGTHEELDRMQHEFRDFDLVSEEAQPEHLREFYRGYFNQRAYYSISDYYNNVYKVQQTVPMYEASYIKNGVYQANIYIAHDELAVRAHFIEERQGCQLVGIRKTTYAKPGQPIINLTRGGK